jgi:hypothetical protein
MAHAVIRQPLTLEALVQSQCIPYESFAGQRGSGTEFSQRIAGFFYQYNSTKALYIFIHRSSALYNLNS